MESLNHFAEYGDLTPSEIERLHFILGLFNDDLKRCEDYNGEEYIAMPGKFNHADVIIIGMRFKEGMIPLMVIPREYNIKLLFNTQGEGPNFDIDEQ
jgi:hypothetical protein